MIVHLGQGTSDRRLYRGDGIVCLVVVCDRQEENPGAPTNCPDAGGGHLRVRVLRSKAHDVRSLATGHAHFNMRDLPIKSLVLARDC